MWFSIFTIRGLPWIPKLIVELTVNLAIYGILAAVVAFGFHYGWYYR